MSTHVQSHCNLPQIRKRDREGEVWSCSCGQVWRLGYFSGFESKRLTWNRFTKVKPHQFEAPRFVTGI